MNKRSANNVTKSLKSSVATIVETAGIPVVESKKVAIDASDNLESVKIKLTDALNQSSDDLAANVKIAEIPVLKTVAEIATELAAIKAKREELAKMKDAKREELKQQREVDKMLAALKAEQDALSNEESEDVTLDDEESNEEFNAAFAKDNYKVSQQEQDKFFITALKANGNSVDRIGILRDYWKAHSAEFRAINANNTTKGEKQQKAIMRRTVNRLKLAGIVEHDKTNSTRIALNLDALKKAETAETESK